MKLIVFVLYDLDKAPDEKIAPGAICAGVARKYDANVWYWESVAGVGKGSYCNEYGSRMVRFIEDVAGVEYLFECAYGLDLGSIVDVVRADLFRRQWHDIA